MSRADEKQQSKDNRYINTQYTEYRPTQIRYSGYPLSFFISTLVIALDKSARNRMLIIENVVFFPLIRLHKLSVPAFGHRVWGSRELKRVSPQHVESLFALSR